MVSVDIWHTILIFSLDFMLLHLCTNTSGNGIRLAGGAIANEGRVEVYLNGTWGTVCGYYWDIHDAVVVCRQLGYSSAISAHGSAYFGVGTGPIHYGNMACKGTETYLADCLHSRVRYCGHRNDAGVVCDTRIGKLARKMYVMMMVVAAMVEVVTAWW